MTETTHPRPRDLSVTETAKLVRTALKRAFPGEQFSVRSKSYSGGASIRVNWTDGPTESEVRAIVAPYAGAEFDSSIDLKHSCESWLSPDGTATWGYALGTVGSMGSDPGYAFAPPTSDAELVRFGADFVFTERDYSVSFLERMSEEACAYYGFDDQPRVAQSRYDGHGYIDRSDPAASVRPFGNSSMDVHDLIYKRAQETRGEVAR